MIVVMALVKSLDYNKESEKQFASIFMIAKYQWVEDDMGKDRYNACHTSLFMVFY